MKFARLRFVSLPFFLFLFGVCHAGNPLQRFLRSTPSKTELNDAMLMPGTNFCGKGWRAESFSHLGVYGRADRCCRQHDLGCPDTIQPMTSKHGLYNWRMYTTMNCECDERFRSCLKMIKSRSADTVGKVFFNMMKTPCFVFRTTDVCVDWSWWGGCNKYEKKRTAVWRDAIPY